MFPQRITLRIRLKMRFVHKCVVICHQATSNGKTAKLSWTKRAGTAFKFRDVTETAHNSLEQMLSGSRYIHYCNDN